MRVRVGKSAAAPVPAGPDERASYIASRALGEEGSALLVFSDSYWRGARADLTKAASDAERITRLQKRECSSWIAEIPDGGVHLKQGLQKADGLTVFWSPLAPESLFLTPEKVLENDDVVVIAQAGEVGVAKHAARNPELAHALERQVKLIKTDSTDEERYVLGVVLEPNVVDTQNDFESPEEIRKAAHLFMEEYGDLGTQHTEIVTGKVKILESYIAPADFDFGDEKVTKGSWLLGVRVVDDGLWADVKKGTFTGYSIGGSAYRTPAEVPQSLKV